MSKILICGASSFVGKGFKELAISKGHEVETFSRGNNTERIGNHIKGNYLEIDQNSQLSPEYEVVINFAVLKDSSVILNIEYAKALLKMCRGHKVKKLIHFSSIMVYDRHNKEINEDTPIEKSIETSMKGYGQLKIAVDEYLLSVKDQQPFEIVFARPGFVLADGMQSPFIKSFPGGINVILGNKKSTLPIVRRNDIHKALLKVIDKENNMGVYHFFPNDQATKVAYANEHVNGVIITLPEWLFKGVPYILAKSHIIPFSLYSRFEGMYTKSSYSSGETEKYLGVKFN
ncbi:MAG: NAD(P)-dependent oxidoreductase [Muribaculum sp.]|nr:NAD(P)-dependent oxidoreductase [Muribaculum sp.]